MIRYFNVFYYKYGNRIIDKQIIICKFLNV